MSAYSLKGNSRYGSFAIDAEFVGQWEKVDGWSKYKIAIWNSEKVSITIQQSLDGHSIDFEEIWSDIEKPSHYQKADNPLNAYMIEGRIRQPYIRVIMTNTSGLLQEENRLWTQVYQNGHLDAREDNVMVVGYDDVADREDKHLKIKAFSDRGVNRLATNSLLVGLDNSAVGNPIEKNIDCIVDGDGKNRLAVDTKVSVENIQLNATTDSITIFGTHDGTPTAIACDANGNMAIDVKVEGITLTPQTDGISIYGTDGANPVQLQTDATEVGSLKTTNTDVSKMEVNANKASSETTFITTATSFASNTGMNATMDLGTGEDRYRNVLFRGKVDASVKTTPKIGMFYSHDGNNYTSDGTYCSFYKNGTNWEFAFQRSNIGCRYVGLICFVECDVSYLSAVMSKN